MAEASYPTTALTDSDSAHPAVRRAFGLSVTATLIGLVILVAVGLLSATNGAAGLPVKGVFASLFDWIPLLG